MKEPILIRETLLQGLLEACETHYPKEFFALLSTREKGDPVIEEFVVVPTEFGFDHAVPRIDLLPVDDRIIGTIHSHPNGIASPSSADLDAFAGMGSVHYIARNPFVEKNVRAFDAMGRKLEWKAVH